MVTVGDIAVMLRASSTGLRSDLDDARKESTSWATNLGGKMSSLLGGAVVAGVGAAATAVVGIGAAAFKAANDFDTATKKIQSQLALTDEQAQRYGDSIKNIFANNFGEDAADIAESLSQVERAFTRIGGTESFGELEDATESALALRDAFEVGVNESTEAAVELMSKFGLTSKQAFDFIASGYQQGLDSSGDFLDSITEYSTQFSEGGADASQFFNLLQTGLQAGALGTDKAADAFKEFRIRIGDGSKLTAQGLEALGINADAFTEKIANGSLTSIDAFEQVIQKLGEIEDPTLRMQAGVALIGTQFEDLGDSAVLGLSVASFELSDQAGAVDALSKQYATLGTFLEGLRRRALVAITPIGEALLGVANEALPYIEEAFGRAEAAVKKFIENSSFTWSPEFKQIKLGDLFEFVSQDGLTQINIGEWFEFTGFGDARQIKIGDLFEFTSDSTGTTINLADYITIEYNATGTKKQIKVGELFEFTRSGELTQVNVGDFIEFTSFGEAKQFRVQDFFEFTTDSKKTQINILDVVEIVAEPEGGPVQVDLSKLFTWDKEKVGKLYLSDFIPWIGESEEPFFDLSSVVGFDLTKFDKLSISDIFDFTDGEGGAFDLGALFEFDPESVGTITLGDILPFLGEGDTIKLTDYITLGTETPVFELNMLFPFLGDDNKLDVAGLFAFDPTSVGTISLRDIFPWLPEGDSPTLDLAALFSGDGELSQFSTELAGDLDDAAANLSKALEDPTWLTDLIDFTFPTLEEATQATLDGMIAWVFPDAPPTIDELLAWDWPTVPELIGSLIKFVWPGLGPTTENAITEITSWVWPTLETPGWITTFSSAVNRLLGWSPPPIQVPGGGGGGGGGFGGGSSGTGGGSSGSIGPNNARSSSVSASAVGATAGGATVIIQNVNIYNQTDIEALAYEVGQRLAYAT